MQPMTVFYRALVIPALAFSVLSCKQTEKSTCEENPVPDAWEQYEELVPKDVRVCGSNAQSSDDNPPNHLAIVYDGGSTINSAFNGTINLYRDKGWKLGEHSTEGDASEATLTKDDAEIRIIVSESGSGEVQGVFEIRKGPGSDVEKGGGKKKKKKKKKSDKKKEKSD